MFYFKNTSVCFKTFYLILVSGMCTLTLLGFCKNSNLFTRVPQIFRFSHKDYIYVEISSHGVHTHIFRLSCKGLTVIQT